MQIIEQLTEDTFVIQLDDRVFNRESQFYIEHDYIAYSKLGSLQTKDQSVKLFGKYQMYGNGIYWRDHIQIPIRVAQQIILPMLLESDYMKPEHLISSDGPIYQSTTQVVHYYNRITKTHMVAVRLSRETEFNHMTLQFYNQFIKHQVYDIHTD